MCKLFLRYFSVRFMAHKVALRIKLIWLTIFLTMKNNIVLTKKYILLSVGQIELMYKDSIQLYVIGLEAKLNYCSLSFIR